MMSPHPSRFKPHIRHPIAIGDGEHVCIIDVGSIGAMRVEAEVILSRFPGGLPDEFELVFSIACRSGGSEVIYFDGRQSKHVLPNRQDRTAIMTAICDAVRLLISITSPRLLAFMTYSPDLPDKALVKYRHVIAMLEESGYCLVKETLMYGRLSWTMERDGDQASA